MIPKRKSQKSSVEVFRRTDRQKVLNTNTAFAIKESYSMIRTNLLFTNKDDGCPIYAITSALPHDGKSINSINIAVSFAQMNKRVLLIDADMRNATTHKYFGMESANGLSEFLAGMNKKLTIKRTDVEGLDIVTSGQYPPNPSELLASNRMEVLLKMLQEEYDYIFIDTPPVEVVTDATVIAPLVTGYVFIVKNGTTELPLLKHAVQILEQVNANVLGFVLNNVNSKSRGYYKSYNYKYGYKKNYSYNKYGYGYGKQ